MKAKTLALLSIILLIAMMLTVAISADTATERQRIFEAAKAACPEAYHKYYLSPAQNILNMIDTITEAQADQVIAEIQAAKANLTVDRGPSLSEYTDAEITDAVSHFRSVCGILDLGYRIETHHDAHLDDQSVYLWWPSSDPADSANHIELDGDDLLAPSSPSTGGSGTTYYSIRFNTNGGSDVVNQRVKRNSYVTVPEEPVKEGYEFAGWYIDEALTIPFDFDTKVKEAYVLYAKWTEVTEPVDPVEWENPYDDVSETDWYYNDLKTLTELGYINGISDNEFGGNLPLTRGMFVTILHRIDGSPVASADCEFEDVIDGAWYEAGVNWANENGIVTGFNDKEFRPDIPITREQMAAVLFRYARYKGMDAVTLQESLHFLDSDEISEYAIPAMNWATSVRIIRGHGDGTVTPTAYATRAHVTAVFVRLLEFMGAIK